MKTLAAGIVAIMFFTSCAKKGCTDGDATNFCDKCKKDDGSCTYNGKLVFWWSKSFADSCAANSVTAVKVYADGAFQGTLAVSSQYWTSTPGCGANSTITVSRDLGKSKTKGIGLAYTYTIGGVESAMLGQETLTLAANTCISYQLTW